MTDLKGKLKARKEQRGEIDQEIMEKEKEGKGKDQRKEVIGNHEVRKEERREEKG